MKLVNLDAWVEYKEEATALEAEDCSLPIHTRQVPTRPHKIKN